MCKGDWIKTGIKLMEQKSILITGCSSGIGYDAAHRLQAEGWRVFASCRKADDVARLRAEGLESVRIDYSLEATIASGLHEVLEKTDGRLDALFNNGAFACPGAVEDLPRAALAALFETNLFGYHDLTRQVIPIMRAQGSGRILNCSSVLGFIALPWRGAYVASKFALEGLTHTLRLEMRDSPIDVVLIQPGPITSHIRQNAIPHFEKWIDWRGSARAAFYERHLVKRLYEDTGPDKFELPASAVSDTLLRALSVKKPRANYYVTAPTYMASWMRRLLPQRALDYLLTRG